MYRRKTAALCIVALLAASIPPAAKADINGECDPYAAAVPLAVAVFIGARLV